MNACTIIAKNYLAFARVLARSFAEQHPGSRLWVLIIDDYEGYIDPEQEPFEILTPAMVGCEAFIEMALRYTVLELSTAVKPWLLRHLMQTTSGPVTYLDPDIRVFADLRRLDALADAHGLVLTPHNNTPVPADGRRPGQIDIMIAGVYNLGYVTVAPRAEIDQLMDWWSDRLLRDCRVDPIWGYFVDQRWFDLAPGLVSDLSILRDPEFNVAYWNLHSRRLAASDQGYSVDGRPLAFFHFSGFDPRVPLVLSRHQDRVDVTANPALERILAEYADAVMQAGHEVSSQWPYGFTAFGDGSPLEPHLRLAYDQFSDDLRARGGAVPSPFALEGVQAFDAWLAGQAPDMPAGISRAVARVYANRPDLRQLYDEQGAAALAEWGREYGPREDVLIARSLRSPHGLELGDGAGEVSPQRLTEPLGEGPWGVNVIGHFRSDDESGEIARELVAALDAARVPALPVQSPTAIVAGHGGLHADVPGDAQDAPFPVNLLCLDGAALAAFARSAGSDYFSGRYSIGLWSPDSGEPPGSWRASLSMLEEVWVPSAYVADGIARSTSLPVTTVPIPAEPPPERLLARDQLGVPCDGTLFVTRFDCADRLHARNPLGAIEAFAASAAHEQGATLIVHIVNPGRAPGAFAEVREAAASADGVLLRATRMSQPEEQSLLAAADAYLSLHRGVGFGLEMAQAMWHGTAVIATGYSGNLDFMSDETALLVSHRLIPIGADGEGLSAEARWAEPDLESAVEQIRRVGSDPAAVAAIATRGQEAIRATHSRRTCGEAMQRRLEMIRSQGRVRHSGPMSSTAWLAAGRAQQALHASPGIAAPGRGRRPRQLARQGLLRVMRPVTSDQNAVNRAIVAAIEELGQNLIDQRRDDAVRRADTLAALRRSEELIPLARAQLDAVGELKRMATLSTDRSVYLALAELGRRYAAVAEGSLGEPPDRGLAGSELRVFSQNGEDGVLAEILGRIGVSERFFVEFGIESGREGNCVYLADVAGWRGLFMEGGDAFFAALQRKYAAQASVSTVKAMVTPANIEELLRAASVPAEPDILSIDVDGQDYWIWHAVQSFRPRVVVIEYNSALDPRRRLVQPNDPLGGWDGTDYFGASLGALAGLGRDKGYTLVHTELSGANAFFVRDDLVADRFPDPVDVARRGLPNYFQNGYRHPASHGVGRYIDLDHPGAGPDRPPAAGQPGP
ncbi:MAG TPA: hypothetical protein VFN55_03280 [Solirubrobacteraceae bacterium]|nr:hypothetical protein [Solirubrobacteraceae bacterium]